MSNKVQISKTRAFRIGKLLSTLDLIRQLLDHDPNTFADPYMREMVFRSIKPNELSNMSMNMLEKALDAHMKDVEQNP
jgi:hypothetical protein